MTDEELRERFEQLHEMIYENFARMDAKFTTRQSTFEEELRHTNAKIDEVDRQVRFLAESQAAANERADKTDACVVSIDGKVDQLVLRANGTDRRLESTDRRLESIETILRNGHSTTRKSTVRKPTTRKPLRNRR